MIIQRKPLLKQQKYLKIIDTNGNIYKENIDSKFSHLQPSMFIDSEFVPQKFI